MYPASSQLEKMPREIALRESCLALQIKKVHLFHLSQEHQNL
jgi:hypothetical protein